MRKRFNHLNFNFADPFFTRIELNTLLEERIPYLILNHDIDAPKQFEENLDPISFDPMRQVFQVLNTGLDSQLVAHLQIVVCSQSFKYHVERGLRFYGMDITDLIKNVLNFTYESYDGREIIKKHKKEFESAILNSLILNSTQTSQAIEMEIYQLYSIKNFDVLTNDGHEEFNKMLSKFDPRRRSADQDEKSYFDLKKEEVCRLSDILIFSINRRIKTIVLDQIFDFRGKKYKILGFTTKLKNGKMIASVLKTSDDGVFKLQTIVDEKSQTMLLNKNGSITSLHLQFLYLEEVDAFASEEFAHLAKNSKDDDSSSSELSCD